MSSNHIASVGMFSRQMKKIILAATGLFVFTALNVQALSIDSVSVTGTNSASGAVTVGATINGASAYGAMATFQVTSADGLTRRYFYPALVSGTSWSSSEWIPYFVGSFIVDITAWDNDHMSLPVTASTTVTVTRAVSGMVNGIKYSTLPYNPDGVWANVDTSLVKLHDIGLSQDVIGVGSVGCNLLNANPGDTFQMSEEQRDIAYTDTSSYKPAGTPYRFDVSLHARPRGFMGMGEIKRWIWYPYDTNNIDGQGVLVVDIAACSPWRSSYSNALQSHVGFAPLFAPSNFSMMPTGMIMCTSAHYMDVGPTNAGSQAEMRCGLRVSGHSGTNSYLKTFLSDTFLQQQFGLTNILDVTNIFAGFVQHFDTNGIAIDSPTEVTASFTRVPGGTNILYDYNADGVGDSGFEAIMNFEFHSSVNAQMGIASTGEAASAYAALAADFDGDRLVDPALYCRTNGTWSEKLSGSDYARTNLVAYLGGSGYAAVAGDFDGDRLADQAVYQDSNGTWLIKLSSSGYTLLTLANFLGGSGYTALAGDFDGDRLADPAVYQEATGSWIIKLSGSGYTSLPLSGFLGSTGYTALAGDFDGDRLADPAVYQEATGSWIIKLSGSGYTSLPLSGFLGSTGYTAMAGDFDGDRLADPAVAEVSTGNWKVKLSGGGYSLLELNGFLGE
jgi:hypothetical protein